MQITDQLTFNQCSFSQCIIPAVGLNHCALEELFSKPFNLIGKIFLSTGNKHSLNCLHLIEL